MEISKEKEAHVVLVHGACHGAWCWYKLKPLLEACGLRVTALDLSASGIDSRSLQELRSFKDYTQPLLELMESLPPEEKVVLVGHSLGGINIGLAMDMFPHKISVAVFLAAFMPDSVHGQSYVLDQLSVQIPPENLDTVFSAFGTPEEPLTAMLFGPLFLSKLYHLCSPEEVALAKMLSRPCSLFLEDLSKKAPFSNERFGSLKRIYIVCTEDKSFPLIFQEWLIETIGVDEVKQIEADHMPMISRPKELCQCLVDIATKYN